MFDPGALIGGLAHSAATADADEFWTWTLITVAAALAGAFMAYRSLHKARLIENTPTSLIRSAAQGYVELDGSVHLLPGPDIVSPLSGARCCWWRYRIEERQSNWVNGSNRREWRTIASGVSDDMFALSDHTGECVIDPDGATVYPSLNRRWYGSSSRPDRIPDKTPWFSVGKYRYREELLHIGVPLYALGWFRTQSGHHEFDESGDVTALLREWKADKRRLLQRFDANGDGSIDLQEWEAARRAAIEHVRAAQLQRALDPDVHVLCQPADNRPYLLSAVPQHRLTRQYRLGALVWIVVAVLASGFALVALHARHLL